MAIDMTPEARPHEAATHSVTEEAYQALDQLVASCGELPDDFLVHRQNVVFSTQGLKTDTVHFPCPLREQEAMLAIKAVEACAAAAIADLKANRAGTRQHSHGRQIMVDADKTSCFLMSAYLTTVDNMGKQHVDVMSKVPGMSPKIALASRVRADTRQTATYTRPSPFCIVACRPISTRPGTRENSTTSMALSRPPGLSRCSASHPLILK